MRTSVMTSATGSEYSRRVSCWTSRIIAALSTSVLDRGSVKRVLLLHGLSDLSASLQSPGQEPVQIRRNDVIDFPVLEVAQDPAQDAAGPARLVIADRPFN